MKRIAIAALFAVFCICGTASAQQTIIQNATLTGQTTNGRK